MWEHSALGPPEVIRLADFSGQFAWATIVHQGVELWVTMSLSHVSPFERHILSVDTTDKNLSLWQHDGEPEIQAAEED